MALYFYRAFSREGKKVTGYIDASSTAAVKEQLTRQGFYPVSISPAVSEAKERWWQRLFARAVTQKDKILFTKQLAVLLKAGVPLVQAIELLSDQFSGKMRSILITVKDDIKGGKSFADSLKKYPKDFSSIYVQLVRAGEAAGNLEIILERLTAYMERQEALKKRVQSAMTMPIIQLVAAVVVVGFLMIKVVPGIVEAFVKPGKKLPFTTQTLLTLSQFLQAYYLPFIIVVVLLIIGFSYWKTTAAGARRLDQIKLKLPIIGHFTRINAIVQFCQTLGMLLESGVNLSESLDIVVKVINNQILADTLKKAKDKIVKQGKIAQYLKQTKIFPPIAIYMISTGEETGQLDTMLLNVAKNYEEDLREYSDKLTELIGPVMLIVMAVIVGFIVLSVAQPMMQMFEGIESPGGM